MTRRCDCQEWQDSVGQIDDAMMFCANRSAGPKYTGPIFKFCPWCGSRLPAVAEANEAYFCSCKVFQPDPNITAVVCINCGKLQGGLPSNSTNGGGTNEFQ